MQIWGENSTKFQAIRTGDDCTEKRYISDMVKPGDIIPHAFNFIDAGCGTGKTTFCTKHLFELFPDLKPYEIVFATSRSAVANQMTMDDDVLVRRLYGHNMDELYDDFGDTDLGKLEKRGITVMTYDMFSRCFLPGCQPEGKPAFYDKKIIVIDECQSVVCDKFMSGIDVIQSNIRMLVYYSDIIVIGLTATSGVFYMGNEKWNLPVHQVCERIPTNNPSDHFIYTRMEYIPQLLQSGKIIGRTIIMAPSIKHCVYLQNRIENSAIVVSQSHKRDEPNAAKLAAGEAVVYEKYMDDIRSVIVNHRTLPDTIRRRDPVTGGMIQQKLEVLITTTTLREGFSLIEESGVQNIISCFADDVNTVQFQGRCRYSCKNFIVAPPIKAPNYYTYPEYQKRFTREYEQLWRGDDYGWLRSVASLISHDIFDDAEKYVPDNEEDIMANLSFVDRISKYLDGTPFDNDGVTEIINIAREMRVLPGMRISHYSKKHVFGYLDSIGYIVYVVHDRTTVNGKRNDKYMYKLERKSEDE